MTITDLITQTRAQYNASSDSFFSDTEIIQYFYESSTILSREALVIEATDTSTSTIIGTQAYTVPTNAIILKRLTYNGQKLKPIDFREDDALTYLNQNVTTTGTPLYYVIFNRQTFLRPIPDAVKPLAFFTFNMPSAMTALSTLEVPAQFHMSLIPYALSAMYSKDKDFSAAGCYKALWLEHVSEAKKWAKKQKRGDSFASVKSDEGSYETILGYL